MEDKKTFFKKVVGLDVVGLPSPLIGIPLSSSPLVEDASGDAAPARQTKKGKIKDFDVLGLVLTCETPFNLLNAV